MRTQVIISAAAAALALVACNKNGGTAPAAVDNANNAVASSSPPVAGAQDAAAGAVGQVSALATTTAQGFVTAAATSDMYEIAAAKIAEQKSHNPQVKQFAAKMIHDHTASTAALKKVLAGNANLQAPTELDERRKGMINNLNAAGANFDKTYMDQQVAAHEEAVSLLQGYQSKGDNADLKAFAAKILPTVQGHLDMAKQIDAGLK